MPYSNVRSGYDYSSRSAGSPGNPAHPPTHSELGTYGVLTDKGIEWENDDGYSDSLVGRIRAGVDFLDTHPDLAVVVDTADATGIPVQLVHRRLSRDNLSGRYTCRTHADNDRLVEMRVTG